MDEDSGGCFYNFSGNFSRDSIFDSDISRRIMFPSSSTSDFYNFKKDVIVASFENDEKLEFAELLPPHNPSRKEKITKCIKIRIYPNSFQKNYFKHCEQIHNSFYNAAIEVISEKMSKGIKVGGRKDIRGELKHLFRMDGVFYATKEIAINDALTSYKSASELAKQRRNKSFTLNQKENNLQRGYFNVDPAAIKIFGERKSGEVKISIFKRELGDNSVITLTDPRVKEIISFRTCKLSRNGSKYFFCVPITVDPDEFLNTDKAISLDPGEKHPFTGFDGEKAYEFGERTRKIIARKFSQLDSLNKNIFSSKERIPKKTYKNARRKRTRINRKITNCIDNFHKQTSNFLTKEFDTILLPVFKSKKIIEGDLNKKSKRMIQAFSHYRFREILKQQCLRRGKRLVICDEYFTSKTCGKCGELNEIGNNREFTCENCQTHYDRDLNAARNIFMRFLKFNLEDLKYPLKRPSGDFKLVD